RLRHPAGVQRPLRRVVAEPRAGGRPLEGGGRAAADAGDVGGRGPRHGRRLGRRLPRRAAPRHPRDPGAGAHAGGRTAAGGDAVSTVPLATPSPSLPTWGRVPLGGLGRTFPRTRSDTSPLVGEVGR